MRAPMTMTPTKTPLQREIVRGIGAAKGPSEQQREARRKRRSEIERLSRQRRHDHFDSMRAEVARLQQELSRVQLGAADNELRQQFLYAVNEVRRLRDEQSRLQDLIHEHALLSISLHEIADSFVQEEMVTWDQALAAWFDPLTMQDALAVMKDCCEMITSFDLDLATFESSGGAFMGWRDRRKLDEATSTMLYCFTKTYANEDPVALMESSWDMMSQERFLQKTIVNTSTELRIQVLQEITRDIRVVRRRTKYATMNGRGFQTVYLQFRLQTLDGFTICFKTIKTPEIERSLDANNSWVEIFHWISFRYVANGGCEVAFGGSIGAGTRAFALHWLIESILAVVRWECVCVAPLFIMDNSICVENR